MGRMGIWSVVALVLMVPWTIRNYRVFNQIVLVSPRTTALTSKVWGNNIMNWDVVNADDDQINASINYREGRDAELYKKHDLKPRRFGKCEMYLKALIHFWQPTYFRPTLIQYGFRVKTWSLKHNLAGLFGYGLFLPFYPIGIFLLLKRRNALGLFIAVIPLIHCFVHTLMIWPLARYRAPVVFCVLCVALWAICELYERRKCLSAQDKVA